MKHHVRVDVGYRVDALARAAVGLIHKSREPRRSTYMAGEYGVYKRYEVSLALFSNEKLR